MPHGFPRLAGRLPRFTAVLVTTMLSVVAPAVKAQAPTPPTSFTYHDAQGDGRLLVYDVGADDVTGGRTIKVSLTQNNLNYYGSGFTLPLQTTMPFKTLISFTLVSARTGISYHFEGNTISGITLSGQGTYHRAGVPEQKASWSIVLGGGGGGTTGPSAIRGTALAGPIYPIERPGIPNTRPLAGAIITLQPDGGGLEITRVTADQDGRFQIPVSPGTYLLVPLPPNPNAVLPRGTPQTVVVKAGGFTDVTVQYDTGIR